MSIKAVIFDLDGTILDTEKLLVKYWCEAANSLGYPMERRHALEIRSLTHRLTAPLFKEWFGEDCDYLEIRAIRMKLMQEHIDKYGLDVKAGARELLLWLGEKGYKRAVATATDIERAGQLLKTAGLYDCFDNVISASMVEWGKPRPDIYIYAAEQLGLPTSECIAVEDSPNGIISASDAGCKTIMVPDLTEPEEELKPRLFACCDSLADIIGILEEGNC